MKKTQTLDYLRKTNTNKRKPKGQKGQNVIINKVGKDCILDKSRKVITEVVKNSCKGS